MRQKEENIIKDGTKSFPIRNQMVMMFFIVILPLFAASIMLLVNMRTIIKDQTLSSTVSSSNSIRYRTMDMVESTDSIMRMFAGSGELKSFLEKRSSEKSEYYDFYAKNIHVQYVQTSPQVSNIYVFINRNEFVYNSNYIYADESVLTQKWYNSAAKDPSTAVWDIIKSPTDGKYYLGCAQAITDTSNETVTAVAVAVISDEWLIRVMPDEHIRTVMCVGGKAFFSDFAEIVKGDSVSGDNDLNVNDISKTYDYGFWGYDGYTVLNNFTINHNADFQLVMLIPNSYINYSLSRLSVVYGGYCGLMLILSLLIIILFTSVFSRRIKLLSEKMHAVAEGDINVTFNDKGGDEIADLYSDLNQMIASMQKMMDDIYQAKLQNEAFKFDQMEAEFKALASQINPHFLYNTLETIRMKAYCNNDKETADLVKKLGKFMRRCLEFKDGEVTLRSELEFTNSYLELQTARFGDRVSYSIYSEVSKDYMILPLLIQPVVENAFVHGIEGCKSNGHIDIKVYYHNDCVVIDVSDNGSGITPERLAELEEKLRRNDTSSGKSIGLTNVNKRIKMYHGEQYGLSIKTAPEAGTTIRITLPRNPVQKKITVQDTDKEK